MSLSINIQEKRVAIISLGIYQCPLALQEKAVDVLSLHERALIETPIDVLSLSKREVYTWLESIHNLARDICRCPSHSRYLSMSIPSLSTRELYSQYTSRCPLVLHERVLIQRHLSMFSRSPKREVYARDISRCPVALHDRESSNPETSIDVLSLSKREV